MLFGNPNASGFMKRNESVPLITHAAENEFIVHNNNKYTRLFSE